MSMYAKLFTSIYQGTLRGNSHGLLVFTNLLAHADQHGVVDIHPKAIADEVGLSQEQVRAALLELESPDAESRTPDEEGRRLIRMDEHRAWGWRVVNYIKYRSIRSEDDRREQNREAQKRWRERNQSKPPSAADKQDKPIQKQKQKQENTSSSPDGEGVDVHEFPPGFSEFWKAYPRKVGKDAAARAFAKRRPGKILLEEMLAAIAKQRTSMQWTRDGGQFIPHPATWINEGRWQDGGPVVDDRFAGAL